MSTEDIKEQLASRLWNRDMMSDARDFRERVTVVRRYAILSVPRSGSTLLSRELHRWGRAGDPHEYLNPSAIAAYQAMNKNSEVDFRQYLHEIESRRTSANGYFGIKVHYFHLSRLSRTEESKRYLVGQFLNCQDRRILITRRDKIAQSVSYYLAQRTGRWTSEHEKYLDNSLGTICEFDALAISRCFQRIVEDEEGWRRALARTGLEYIEIVFEDFLASYQETLGRVASYLGINDIESPIEPALTPTTNPAAAELCERFRKYLSYG